MSPSPEQSALVSIVIPTYRRPAQVRRAALSALSQTWPEIEVIVVSDGPDSATRDQLKDLGDRLVHVELEENGGPAAARNAGVAGSRGEWLAFLDDDDLMLPDRVEAAMRIADPQQPRTMVCCRLIYKRGIREDIWPARPIEADEDVADYLLRRPSLTGRPGILPLQGLLVHRTVVERVAFSTHRDHEDWAWLLEVWHLLGARVQFAWQPLVVYTIDEDGQSRSRRTNWADSLAWAQQYRTWIGDRAFCSFLATKAALKAKRAGDRQGLRQIAREVMHSHPGPLEVMFLAGVLLAPAGLLQFAWKRSLRSEATSTSAPREPEPQAVAG